MADPRSGARRAMLAEFQKARNEPAWPTVRLDRTIAELEAQADEIYEESRRKAAAKAEQQKAKKRAEMLADPSKTLHETEKLVKHHGRDSYEEIAKLLAQLREVLAGSKQAGLAEQQAQKLRSENPTLRVLISELRKKGFLPK